MKDIAIIQACCDLGVHVYGADLAPELITKDIRNPNIYTVKAKPYQKQLEKENKQKNLEGVNEFNTRLYKQVQDVMKRDFLPMTIGGDHSIAIASALASISKYGNLGMIWFDSHGDFNTFETTISGNIHGLPLAVITNYEKKLLSDFHQGNYYDCENTVIVGARDLDLLEKENLKKSGVTVFTTEDIKKEGARKICQKAFAIALQGTQGVHISYDIDLIDPEIAPGVSIPAINGINLEEAYTLVDEIIQQREMVKSIDIVEFNPLRDEYQKTEKIAKTICYKLYDNLLKNQQNCDIT